MTKAHRVIQDNTVTIVPHNYYVRENKDDTNLSPALTFTVAIDYARKFSFDNDSGLAEVFTYVGTRDGDSENTPVHLEVVALFRRGKMLLTGSVANFVSSKGLPPAH